MPTTGSTIRLCAAVCSIWQGLWPAAPNEFRGISASARPGGPSRKSGLTPNKQDCINAEVLPSIFDAFGKGRDAEPIEDLLGHSPLPHRARASPGTRNATALPIIAAVRERGQLTVLVARIVGDDQDQFGQSLVDALRVSDGLKALRTCETFAPEKTGFILDAENKKLAFRSGRKGKLSRSRSPALSPCWSTTTRSS